MLRIRCMLAVYRWSSTKSYIGLVWGLTGRCFSWLISQFQPLRHYGWVWVGLGALLLLHKMHVSCPWKSSTCFTVSWLIFQFQPFRSIILPHSLCPWLIFQFQALQFFTTSYFLLPQFDRIFTHATIDYYRRKTWRMCSTCHHGLLSRKDLNNGLM